jgi:alpha-L-arabinofuranosidase
VEFIGRRQFIEQTLAGSSSLFITNQIFANQIKSLDSRIEILINEPIGTITPDIYGHFIEHLGGVIYDGVWVGEGSKIANINGIRSALIEHMRRLNALARRVLCR